MNDFQHDVVEANGIAIHVASAGNGPPLLFLHGFPHTWFAIGKKRGLPSEARAAFLEAYRGRDSLRCTFAHYRALPENVQRLAKVERLTVPTLAIAGGVVGDALARQLSPL